jgi:hypothetical protein
VESGRELKLGESATALDLHTRGAAFGEFFAPLTRKGMPPELRSLHQASMIMNALFLTV